MEPIQWLKRVAPGFDLLSTEEIKAIADFFFLWSFFEYTVLDNAGNAKTIIHAVKSLSKRGTLTLNPFRDAIRYYSERYYDGTQFTYEFNGLNFRPSDHRSLVEKVIQGRPTDDADILSAILIIVFRLRNNLSHGVKAVYGFRGQLENFRHANTVLMSFVELFSDEAVQPRFPQEPPSTRL